MKKEEVFELLKDAINYVLPEIDTNEITIGNSLKEIGANSVERADIIFTTMEDANVKIPMVSFNNAKNIKDILDIFENATNQ